jgi:hypothetical protein
VKVEYTLTPEDYAAHMREPAQNPAGTPRWLRYVGIGGCFLVAFLQGAALVARGVSWLVVAGVALFVAVLFFMFMRFIQPLVYKALIASAFRRARFPATSLSLEVRPEGLAVATETTASLTTWEGIDRIVVTDSHAFFYLNWTAAHILPRRAFADEREFEEFVDSARSYYEASKLRSAAK